MRKVAKNTEPPEFITWKSKTNNDWLPSYGGLQNPEKRLLHTALLNEQGQACCYCGRAISLDDSHIEHFRPQETREDLALEYGNLYASCIRETKLEASLHCGHAKSNDFDESKAISPQDVECERRFMYSAQDGAIYPTNESDESAKFMTSLLRLDITFLNGRRAEALQRTFDTDFVSSASDEELIKLAHAYRELNSNGQLTSFGHVLSRYAEQLLGRTL
jgi:uncharacterized protein (TIGR02646 family)